ncbi:MAG: YbaK/EbsC family protein [Halodesulfurarchaeum sp.]
MHATIEKFVECASERFDFQVDVHELQEGTKTAKDAADAVGADLEQIVKSMVMNVDGDLIVCLTSGSNEVASAQLAEKFGVSEESVTTADPEVVKNELGWSIGGVPPFCHDSDVPVLMDETLANQDTVWAGGGTPDALFPIDPERLEEYSSAERADVYS